MEAIIFIQKKRGLQAPLIEPIGAKSYLLVRVYVDVGTDNWFGRALREPEPPCIGGKSGCSLQDLQEQQTKKKRRLLQLPDRTETRRQRKQALQKLQQDCEDRWQQYRAYLIAKEHWQVGLEQTRAELLTLKSEIHDLTLGCDDVSVVYGDEVRRALVGAKPPRGWVRMPGETAPEGIYAAGSKKENGINASWLTYIWNSNFPIKEFEGYGKLFWCAQFVPERLKPNFVVLGGGEALLPLLEMHVRKMKSLRWFLRETDYSERLVEQVDSLCEEWGLTPEIHILDGWIALQREGLKCLQESCILDFSKEVYLSAGDVTRGSLWLDVYAVERKRQQLEQKNPHITYYSLRKTWEKLQKRCICEVFP